MQTKVTFKNSRGKTIGTIKDPILTHALLHNIKMTSTLISLYNLIVFYSLKDPDDTDMTCLRGYLLSRSNVARHKIYLKLKGHDSALHNTSLPKISNLEKLSLLKIYRGINNLVHGENVPNNPPKIKGPVTLASLLDKLASDPKAYIPAYHEDYVYSDANWSSKDASL